MAKAQEAAPPQEEEAPPKKRSMGKKLLLIILIGVVVATLAAGGLVAFLLSKKSSSEGAGAESDVPSVATVDLSKPPTFVALDPFVVNLAPGEGERYLQVVMSLHVSDAKTGEHLKGFMPQIRHRINLLLSSRLPSELATTEGREFLALDIVNGINEVLGFPARRNDIPMAPTGPIQAVLFSSFIVQ